MGKFLRYILNGLLSGAVNCLVDLLYGLLAIAEFVACFYVGYQWVYVPLAASPGARDGTGLLFVMLFVLVGALVAAAMLTNLTKHFLRTVFPWWSPTLLEE